MSTEWYAPNQQAVRGDESGPAEEGEGGTERVDPEPVEAAGSSLEEMTKDELLEHARSLGASPANAAMSKAELRESIEAHQAGGG
jgi:hypothetical protein